jgi:hypothetical protein
MLSVRLPPPLYFTGPDAGGLVIAGRAADLRAAIAFNRLTVRRNDPPPLAGLSCSLLRGKDGRLIQGVVLLLLMRSFSWSCNRFVQQVAADDE